MSAEPVKAGCGQDCPPYGRRGNEWLIRSISRSTARQVNAPPGTLVIDAAKTSGHRDPGVLLLRRPHAGRRLPHVPGGSGEDAEADDGLHAAGGRRHGGPHRHRRRWPTARKYTLEFLLTNHPLDCPVCDKGGECELQDMVFRYGAGESRYTEDQVHTPEKQFSPVVFFDAPRCILCFRCVRVCNEGHGRERAGRDQARRGLARSRPTWATTWSATSAAPASTSARSARSPAALIATRPAPGR